MSDQRRMGSIYVKALNFNSFWQTGLCIFQVIQYHMHMTEHDPIQF